ncbi:MAG: hypothetical protein HY747_10555, partial [Elusimicrobia bacterium]|nr:hypothetical protein [Elusimicrobiota bacterium]
MSRPNKIIEVGIGQVKAASASGPISALEARHAPQGLQSSLVSEQGLRSGVGRKAILRADAIGSCIAVAAYDSKKRVGAMAHVMLPGSSPD